MVQIHPVQAVPVDSGVGEVKSSPYVTTEQESFTIWMRSLVYHSKGCTVYDSKGNIIYQVDNYDSKSCGEVYLMDLYGEVLFEFQQSFGLFAKDATQPDNAYGLLKCKLCSFGSEIDSLCKCSAVNENTQTFKGQYI
ncbi:unnamed protein product [Brassica oleracea]